MRILLMFLTGEVGAAFMRLESAYIDEIGFKLVGFFSIEREYAGGEFLGKPIYYEDELNENMCDILILPMLIHGHKNLMLGYKQRLVQGYNFPENKIYFDEFLIRCSMIKKYGDSTDPDILDTLEYWKTYELTVFNRHLAGYKKTYDEVFTDEKYNLPYIFFNTASGKRLKMYYPNNSKEFEVIDGKRYVPNILKEQTEGSPHLYITDTHKIEDGDVIIDAGVCEGNFALRYADVASKIYLFEIDDIWFPPLTATFTEAGANFTLIKKGVGSAPSEKIEKIDNAVDISPKSNYFLKMDVEGAETDALKGADLLLKTGKVKSSICAYHKENDASNIKALLEIYGYKTSFSKGYMTYFYDLDFFFTRDFRHGVVYGD